VCLFNKKLQIDAADFFVNILLFNCFKYCLSRNKHKHILNIVQLVWKMFTHSNLTNFNMHEYRLTQCTVNTHLLIFTRNDVIDDMMYMYLQTIMLTYSADVSLKTFRPIYYVIIVQPRLARATNLSKCLHRPSEFERTKFDCIWRPFSHN
jgi:hypothetical protein